MNPTLYIMLGYPGAGKTTIAAIIAKATGADLIWEDLIRKQIFPSLTFSPEENNSLHEQLNERVGQKLHAGTTVVYDTSFNRFVDRKRMYDIAAQAGAKTVLVWVDTPKDVAKHRATKDAAAQPTRPLAQVLGDMDEVTFDRLCSKLEPPQPHEPHVTIVGIDVTNEIVYEKLGL